MHKQVHNEELYDQHSSPELFGLSNKEEWDGRGRWHDGREEVHT